MDGMRKGGTGVSPVRSFRKGGTGVSPVRSFRKGGTGVSPVRIPSGSRAHYGISMRQLWSAVCSDSGAPLWMGRMLKVELRTAPIPRAVSGLGNLSMIDLSPVISRVPGSADVAESKRRCILIREVQLSAADALPGARPKGQPPYTCSKYRVCFLNTANLTLNL